MINVLTRVHIIVYLQSIVKLIQGASQLEISVILCLDPEHIIALDIKNYENPVVNQGGTSD